MSRIEDSALNAQDVASILHVSRNTVYNLVKAGELSSYMVGRKMRFTMADVDAYIAQSRGVGVALGATSGVGSETSAQESGLANVPAGAPQLGSLASFSIAGRDILADIVSHALGQENLSIRREYINGYWGLNGMYAGTLDATVLHLFDRKTGSFNVPYVQRIVPGRPVVVFQLAKRKAGLLVRKGNPKKISKWRDLTREDVLVANREHGAGARILLDEYLISIGAPASSYVFPIECHSSQAAASFVAEGHADCTIGCEHDVAAEAGLMFVPLVEEELACAILKNANTEEALRALRDLLPGKQFKHEAAQATSYNLDPCGNILYEV